MGSINILKLDKLYSFCQIDAEISRNLRSLYINHTYIDYSDKNIKFSNLKYLTIKDTILDSVFNTNKIDFDSFSNLEHFTIDILATIDFIVLNKILKSSANKIIEFNITYLNELTCSIDEDYYNYYIKEVNENKKQKDEEEEVEENEMEIESESEFDNTMDKISKEFGETILELKELKYLRIYNFDSCPFIKLLLKKYMNENLIEFETDCIKLSSAKQFLKNNPNIKKLKFKE